MSETLFKFIRRRPLGGWAIFLVSAPVCGSQGPKAGRVSDRHAKHPEVAGGPRCALRRPSATAASQPGGPGPLDCILHHRSPLQAAEAPCCPRFAPSAHATNTAARSTNDFAGGPTARASCSVPFSPWPSTHVCASLLLCASPHSCAVKSLTEHGHSVF